MPKRLPVVPCPRCGSEDTISRGCTSTGKPRRMCHGCGRTFAVGDLRTLRRAMPPRGSTPDETFDFYGWKEVQSGLPESPCREWQGPITSTGHGRFKSEGRTFAAHIHAYKREYGAGAIPEGRDLHHVCENKLCVNPLHLNPETTTDHKREHNLMETEFKNRIMALIPEETLNEIKREIVADRMRKHLSSLLRPPAWWWHYAA